MAQRVEHPIDGVLELVRHPVGFSETPASIRAAAPLPGAHTASVLAELGYGAAELDALVAEGAVALESSGRSWA
jgi:crotonobetainyl-CoA:carnitine CoA-transferase CaiB-like acyl-CoA transferase